MFLPFLAFMYRQNTKGESILSGQAKTRSASHISKLEKEQRRAAEEALTKYPKLTATAPDWLDDTATSEWTRIVPLLKQNTPISELDTSLIASHCALYSTVVRMTKAINKYGEVIETDTGHRKQSPYFMARDKAIKEMKSVDTQLGLTPQARARLEIHKAITDEPQDEFEAMLS